MPYCARKHQLGNSLIYHVLNRGNRREAVFNNYNDYAYFIKLLQEYSRRFAFKLYHWVLMPNHYHLLLEINEPELISKCMAGLNRTYTCYYHRLYSTAGFLWQGRFKLQPVQKETYMLACGRYIERNPVKAGIVNQAQEYPYSSAKFYCLGENDNLTIEDPTFIEFGSDIAKRRIAYQDFLRDFNDDEEISFGNLEIPQGNREFINRLIKQHGRFLPRRRGRRIERIVA